MTNVICTLITYSKSPIFSILYLRHCKPDDVYDINGPEITYHLVFLLSIDFQSFQIKLGLDDQWVIIMSPKIICYQHRFSFFF